MARQPQPRRITLGGREAVALTAEEYERLVASRRQIGGQSARVRVLGQQVRRSEQLLRDLETLVAAPAEGCEQLGEVSGPCPASSLTANETGAEAAAKIEAATADVDVDVDVDADADTDPDCLRCAIAALLRRHRGTAS